MTLDERMTAVMRWSAAHYLRDKQAMTEWHYPAWIALWAWLGERRAIDWIARAAGVTR